MTLTHSIKFCLTAFTCVAVIACGAIFGVFWRNSLKKELDRFAKDFAVHEAEEVAGLAERYPSLDDIPQHASDFDFIFDDGRVLAIEVWKADGTLVYRRAVPGVPESGPWSEGFATAIGGEMPYQRFKDPPGPRARSLAPIGAPTAPLGFGLVLIDRSHIPHRLAHFRDRFVVGLAIATILLCGGCWLVTTLALRPVMRMVSDARAVADEGPGRRLDVPPPGSELHHLAELLNRMLDRTEETLGRLGRFTAHAGHELRTPLTRIRGEAEMALLQGTPDAMQTALESALEEIVTLTRVVDALLELAREDPKAIRMSASVDLAALVSELVTEARVLAEERGVQIELRAEPSVSVGGSRELLVRAVWNLLDNATKYCTAGGRILVNVEAREGLAIVEVSNTYEGAPSENMEDLFQPFRRGTKAAATSGLGLGLALSRSVARSHGGQLDSRGWPDGGITFRLEIPARAETAPSS